MRSQEGRTCGDARRDRFSVGVRAHEAGQGSVTVHVEDEHEVVNLIVGVDGDNSIHVPDPTERKDHRVGSDGQRSGGICARVVAAEFGMESAGAAIGQRDAVVRHVRLFRPPAPRYQHRYENQSLHGEGC